MLYKDSYKLSERIKESNKIVSKYPSHIPVIVDTDKSIKLKKNKFIVPHDISAAHFLCSIRKQIEDAKASDAIFLFVDKRLICATKMMQEIYEEHLKDQTDDDKFLYIYVSSENTFGFCLIQ
jgi:hypothetical protein